MGNAINALDQVDSVINSISNNFSNLFSMFGESSESLVEYYIFRDFKEDQFGMLKKIFTEIDTNKDNFLSREEFSNFLSNKQCLQISSERIENLFDDIDLNKDGQISKEEFDQWIDYISTNLNKC